MFSSYQIRLEENSNSLRLKRKKINRKIYFHDKYIKKKNEHNESTSKTASYLLIANKSENEITKLSA